MLDFFLLWLVPSAVFLALLAGVVALVTRRFSEATRGVVKKAAAGIGGIIVLLYSVFVIGLANTHLDTEHLFAPTEQAKLSEWTEFCERLMEDGEFSYALSQLAALGIRPDRQNLPSNGISESVGEHLYYRYYEVDDWVNIYVHDRNVRNRAILGDVLAVTTIRVESEELQSCEAEVARRGR